MRASRRSLTLDLRALGIERGDMLMVHASLRALGPVVGGANVVVQALQDAIGPEGTLVAYLDVELFYDEDDEDVKEDVPVFDERIAPAARDHGVLHEVLRNWPGAIRSDHPDAGVVAIGPAAAWLAADHPFQYGYGEGSPYEKFVTAEGRVLMLGAPLDTITLLHHAEHKAEVPNKRIRRYRRLMPTAASPQWIDFEEFDTANPVLDTLPENCFELIAADYLQTGRGRTGTVGQAPSYVFEGPDLVQFAIAWIEKFAG